MAEQRQLREAAPEFNVGAILASLQDVQPLMIWGECCHTSSELTKACLSLGLAAKRKNLESGYDIEKEVTIARLLDDQRAEKPKRSWWSLKCTPWTSIQNLNARTPQAESLRKKRQKARRGVRNALKSIEALLEADPEAFFYWEWPKSAHTGWNLSEMQMFIQKMKAKGMQLFRTEIHGCMLGSRAPSGEFIKKEWMILNNDKDFHSHCQVF